MKNPRKDSIDWPTSKAALKSSGPGWWQKRAATATANQKQKEGFTMSKSDLLGEVSRIRTEHGGVTMSRNDLLDLPRKASRIRTEHGFDNRPAPTILDLDRHRDEARVDSFLNGPSARKEFANLRKFLGLDSSISAPPPERPGASLISDGPDDEDRDRDWMGFADPQEQEDLLRDLEEMTPSDFEAKWGNHPLVQAFNRARAR